MARVCWIALADSLPACAFVVSIVACYNALFLHSGWRAALCALFTSYLMVVLELVGFPRVDALRIDLAMNLIPLAGMASGWRDACLNALLFAPFGFCLPVLWDRFRRMKRLLPAALAASCAIEASQMFTFRATDVNDMIANAAGAAAGYLIARWLTKGFSRCVVTGADARDLALLCGVASVIAGVLKPLALWKIAR